MDFWDKIWRGQIVLDTIQQLNLKLSRSLVEVIITIVYPRYNALKRSESWEDIEAIAYKNQLPWVIGGGFNVIFNEKEK